MKKDKYLITRWIFPFAGFLLALMGGVSYAWGVFIVPMMKEFGWTKGEAVLPFTVFMVTFAIIMVPAGKLQDKFGPKKVALFGGILFFVAYGSASLVSHFPYPWWLVVTYGIIGGTACGFTYACVAPTARKWFPDKPGFAISIAVMGFGLAALVFAPFKAKYLIINHGIEGTLFILGVMTSIVSILASLMIKNPPPNWRHPQGKAIHKIKKESISKLKKITIRHELTPKEVLRTPTFWIIWTTFALVIAGGFIVLGLIPVYGEQKIGLTPIEAAISISVFATLNGIGRPFAGFLSDKFGVTWVMIITYLLQAITFLFFHIYAKSLMTLLIATASLGWGYAVTLALFPSLTSICFGIKNLGVNYGLVFTAFGVGAISPVIGSWILDATNGNYAPVFISVGILSGIGVILSIILKKKYKLP